MECYSLVALDPSHIPESYHSTFRTKTGNDGKTKLNINKNNSLFPLVHRAQKGLFV